MTIKEQYKSTEWLKRSEEIRKRDNFTCFKCGTRETSKLKLDVHHICKRLGKKIWEYDDEADLSADTCCHTFRATGITTYLLGGGDIETAARIANHELTSTTKLYDRRNQKLTEGEIEKIKF